MFKEMTDIKTGSLENMRKVDAAVVQGEKNFVRYIDELIMLTKDKDMVNV